MRLLIISHKVCWTNGAVVLTDGGFPQQVAALAGLFDVTELCVPVATGPPPATVSPIEGIDRLTALPEPTGVGMVRKLRFVPWLAGQSWRIWKAARRADAIHAPIPGDVGSVGIGIALLRRQPLYVRHCGNWERRRTVSERLWRIGMERMAGGNNVMLATGGGSDLPSPRFPEVRWIFSSSLTDAEIADLGCSRAAPIGRPIRLVVVGRLEHGKGQDLALRTVAELVRRGVDVRLDIVGGGSRAREYLDLASSLELGDRVRFHGAVPRHEVSRLLGEQDLLLLPSKSEGFPKAVLEALACGLPVITSNVSVLPSLVEGCGAIVALDPVHIADAVDSLIEDPSHYAECSRRAAARACSYSLERWSAEIGEHLVRAWGPLQAGGHGP